MKDRVVGVLGAGNLRSSPLTLASLAAWKPDDLVEIRLWDANEERLDLFDRYIRTCFDRAGTQHVAVSSTEICDVVRGATELILCLHEDCARRFIGDSTTQFFDLDESTDTWIILHGDPNKPTLPEHLSDHMKSILSSPRTAISDRTDLMDRAFDQILELVSPVHTRLLNLTRGHQAKGVDFIANLEWPPPAPSGDYSAVPHQVLRWIQGDDSLQQILIASLESPVSNWLNAT